jgi:predicted transcriptional regulator
MTASLFSYFVDNQSPRYSLFDVYKIYTIIDKEGPVGRKELAEALSLGEGTVRTILNRMKEDGAIACTRMGATLTDQGQRRIDGLGITSKPIEIEGLTLGECNYLVVVRGMAARVKDGCMQRDDAVKAGAIGATTLIKKDGKITLLTDSRFPNQSAAERIEKTLPVNDEDAIIIGTANSIDLAERGALAAALKLYAPAVKCWKDDGLLSEYMDPSDMRCLALAFHELVGGMPVSIRTANQLGVLCEDGVVVNDKYTGPNLEEALRTGKTVKKIIKSGRFKGVPVVCVPILKKGKPAVAIGLVDLTKLSIHDLMGRVKGE